MNADNAAILQCHCPQRNMRFQSAGKAHGSETAEPPQLLCLQVWSVIKIEQSMHVALGLVRLTIDDFRKWRKPASMMSALKFRCQIDQCCHMNHNLALKVVVLAPTTMTITTTPTSAAWYLMLTHGCIFFVTRFIIICIK